MNKSKKEEDEPEWHVDDLGVTHWAWGKNRRGAYGDRSPFSDMLDVLQNSQSVPEDFRMSAIHVHDDLEVARSVALSLFGPQWKDHIFDVYDRMIAARARILAARPPDEE